MNRRWLCNDVWMDILPSFDHAQLGLKLALLSDRFDVLVDTHFDGKTELTLLRELTIRKNILPKEKLSVRVNRKFVDFPLPDRPLPNKIRFKNLRIDYIDYSVLTFIRSNKPIWDRNGTKFELSIWSNKTEDDQPIWDVFVREIWPIFATNIRHLHFPDGDHLGNLRRRISPSILTDLDQLSSIDSGHLCTDGIADNEPNSISAGQALAKWLHTPTKDGQPSELRCRTYCYEITLGWINNFKETFLRATTSVAYNVRLELLLASQMSFVEPFNLVNGRTNERLTLEKEGNYCLLKRCPNVGETAAIQWENDGNLDANLNNVKFDFWDGSYCIGPLSPPAEKE